jgi:hypothetical protein
MTLRYPESTAGAPGKTTEREDRYSSRFVELDPPRRVVQAIRFDAADPAFGGEMTMTVSLVEVEGSTAVTISYANVPPGIRPEDNEAGSRMSLEKLAAYLARPGGVATG